MPLPASVLRVLRRKPLFPRNRWHWEELRMHSLHHLEMANRALDAGCFQDATAYATVANAELDLLRYHNGC